MRFASEGAARETPVPPHVLESRAASLLDLAEERTPEAEEAREEVFALLRELVATGLTDRQRVIVELYFTDGLSQAEIAEQLRISQQVVSRQLFGVIRNGKRIGGAIRRLRQLCELHGLDPEQWV